MIFELMKAQRLGIYPDLHTKYVADAFKNTSSTITEMSGELPLAFVTTGLPLTNYKAYGNAVQAATPSTDNPAEVQAVGDKTANLFDKNDCTVAGFINYNGNISTAAHWFTTENYIKCIRTITITALNGLGSGAYIACYDEQKNLLGVCRITDTNQNQSTINLIDGTKYIKTCSRDDNFDSFMLNEGETALPYEPYGYKIPFTTATEDGTESITTTVYLKQPLYKIGDYADTLSYAEQKVERYIKEIVLTGEENLTSTHLDVGLFTLNVRDYLRLSAITVFNTHYQAQKNQNGWTEVNDMSCCLYTNPNNTTSFALYIRDSRFSTIDDFKAYLKEQYNNSTPVKVWYVLQTPETESVELPKLPTLDGVTVIDAATEIKPSKMDIKYTGHRLLMFSRRD